MLLSVVFSAQVGKELRREVIFVVLSYSSARKSGLLHTHPSEKCNFWLFHSPDPGTRAQAPAALWHPVLDLSYHATPPDSAFSLKGSCICILELVIAAQFVISVAQAILSQNFFAQPAP